LGSEPEHGPPRRDRHTLRPRRRDADDLPRARPSEPPRPAGARSLRPFRVGLASDHVLPDEQLSRLAAAGLECEQLDPEHLGRYDGVIALRSPVLAGAERLTILVLDVLAVRSADLADWTERGVAVATAPDRLRSVAAGAVAFLHALAHRVVAHDR